LSIGATVGLAQQTEAPKETSLQEYLELDLDSQNDIIFKKQISLMTFFEEEKQIRRAICIGEIFSEEETGLQKMFEIRNTLEDAATQNVDRTAEEITEAIMTQIYCPEQ
jgi:hypothetical protein